MACGAAGDVAPKENDVERTVERKVTTILVADVEAFSARVERDEEGTLAALGERVAIIEQQVAADGGRVFATGGDSRLAEFPSAVETVRCAVRIQEEIEALNAQAEEERRLRFRIGINLGDVVVDGDDLLGDGVNVAARLEGRAEPGGICISGSVYEQVRKKLALAYDDIGPQQVKNIAEPIPAWRVRMGEAGGEVTPARAPRRTRVLAVILALAVLAGGALWYAAPWPGGAVAELEAAPTTWDAFYLAAIYTALGEKDQAFRWLEAAYRQHHPYIPWVRALRGSFEPLRGDPRLQDLLRRMNLPG